MNLASILIIVTIIYNKAAAQTDSKFCVSIVPGVPGNQQAHGQTGDTGLKGDRGIKGNIGVKGEKGDPGTPGNVGPVGPQGEVGLPGVTGEKGEIGEPATAPSQNKSAFSVALKNDPGSLTNDEPIIYDTIFTNIGNHYNSETGKFVCEYPGTYVFQFTSQKKGGGTYSMVTGLKKNKEKIVYSRDDNQEYSSTSNMVVLDLVADDEVWTCPDYWSTNYYSSRNAHCTFSGFLLYPA